MRKVYLLIFLLVSSLISCKDSIKEYSLVVVQFSKKVPAFNQTYQGLIEGLSDKGYEKGINLKILYFCMDQDSRTFEHLPIEKILKSKKDLIVTLGTVPTKLLLKALPVPNPTPLVFTIVLEPKSLELDENKRKLLNVTGLSMKLPVKKQLYTLKDALPHIKKIGMFYCLDYPQCVYVIKEMEKVCREFGIKPLEATFSNTITFDKLERLCEKLAKRVDVLYLCDPFCHIPEVLKRVVKVTDKFKVPVVCISARCLKYGSLISMHCDFYDLGYRTSGVIDRILKGIPAHSIPIQYPREFKIDINLKKAKELGIHISRNFLLKSDLITY